MKDELEPRLNSRYPKMTAGNPLSCGLSIHNDGIFVDRDSYVSACCVDHVHGPCLGHVPDHDLVHVRDLAGTGYGCRSGL